MSDRRMDITELSNVPSTGDGFHLGLVTDEESQTVLSGDRDPLDRVAEEFVERCRRGEAPSIAEYEGRFPDQAEKVRKLLGAVATMEQLRRGSRQARFMPERIGEFRVLRELGRGGMGVVYEAVQESLWRHVAVKAIHHSQLDSKRLQRFQREAQAVAQLHHTNIVPIFGVGEHDGVPYYAMQYIKGRGLDAVLGSWRDGHAPRGADHWRTAARYALQAADALGYAHEQGVFHRDIKPANLLIDEQDAVWITDFGLAKIVGHEELTASGDVIGTLRYLAPESLRGISDGRSDVYSLGLTLYEMLTLSPPFGDLSPSELLHRVSDGQPIRPRNLDPAIPRDLETIVLKATARELKDRYATAKALASDLNSFLNDRPIQARRINFAERAWRWSRRNRGIAAFATLAVVSLMIAAVSGWIGFVRIDLALQQETLSLREVERDVSILSRLIREMSETLFPEESVEAASIASDPVQVTQALIDRREGEESARLFTDRSDGFGAGPPPDEGFEGGDPGSFRGQGGPGRHHRDHSDGQQDLSAPAGGLGGPASPAGEMRAHPNAFGRGGPSHPGGAERGKTLALLKHVLQAYDQLAESPNNQANPEFESEAGWLYYKMATYNERLGDRAAADQAFDRTLMIFDKLSTRFPTQAKYFRRFFTISSAINPWQRDPAMLQAAGTRLLRIGTTLGRLLQSSPENQEYLRARMQLFAKLGLIRCEQGQTDVSLPFVQALEIADRLIAANPEAGYPHTDRSDVREAYALILDHLGKLAEARRLLDAAMDDLEWVAADELKSESLASRMESLADDFDRLARREPDGAQRLADQGRSSEIQQRADQIDPRPPLADRPRPGPPFGTRRSDPDPVVGEPTPD